jgi:hypothetical protein
VPASQERKRKASGVGPSPSNERKGKRKGFSVGRLLNNEKASSVSPSNEQDSRVGQLPPPDLESLRQRIGRIQREYLHAIRDLHDLARTSTKNQLRAFCVGDPLTGGDKIWMEEKLIMHRLTRALWYVDTMGGHGSPGTIRQDWDMVSDILHCYDRFFDKDYELHPIYSVDDNNHHQDDDTELNMSGSDDHDVHSHHQEDDSEPDVLGSEDYDVHRQSCSDDE